MKSSSASVASVEKKEKLLDSSDYDSDEGASPSFSDTDSSSVSSRASSPGPLKIVENNLVTPKKRTGNNDGDNTPTANTRMSKRKPTIPSASKTKQSGTSVVDAGVIPSNSKVVGNSKPSGNNGSGSTVVNSSRKRKRQKNGNKDSSTRNVPSQCASKRPCLNQRRRTKSERNTRAGKTVTVPVEEVALDAEIDKFLEEKAMENNLTATNVKSIIRHVITNNMVQKMILSTGKKKGNNPGDSSDDEAFYEPKLTRARRKLLVEHDPHNSASLWPSLSASSPVKSNRGQGVSGTHVLIHQELPEDSSGDEEYVPREDEIHSDDENSSVASHTSEVGSPCPLASTSKRVSLSSNRTRQGNKEESSRGVSNNTKDGRASPVFKTPTPVRPKCVRKLDSGISKRTRSKLPLNDTPLEDLEMQLIPPDITTDMYDWGLSDNEDYLAFLKEFLCPGQNASGSNEAGDDDEVADPEYNVMEEEEEHDKEELRMDRAVKVSKKELNELVAELIEESHFTSGEELDDTVFASFCASQLSLATGSNVQEANTPLPSVSSTNSNGQRVEVRPLSRQEGATPTIKKSVQSASQAGSSCSADPIYISVSKREEKVTQNPQRGAGSTPLQTETETTISSSSNKFAPESSLVSNGLSVSTVSPVLLPSGRISITNNTIVPVSFVGSTPTTAAKAVNESVSHPAPFSNSNTNLIPGPQFSSDAIAILKHQIRQHTQFLAQSYVLTVTVDDPSLKNISFHSKRMINEMRSLLVLSGPLSVLSGGNLEFAWNLVNSWPPKSSKSPIKKKILEEKYMNDCQQVPKNSEISSSTERCTFPRPVAKVIAESAAFPYSELLPVRYNQTSSVILKFTLSEDMLIVGAYDDLKEYKLNTREKAQAIARTLLPARTTTQVFHRIKNLRRNSNPSNSHSAIREYFQHGKILPGAEVPKHWDQSLLRPPISQNLEMLPNAWRILILRLAEHSEFSWRGVDGKRRKRSPNKNLANNSDTIPVLSQTSSTDSSPVKQKSKRDSDIISSVFPVGSAMCQMLKCEDVESFPIRDTNGNPGVWISIPKWLPKKSELCSSVSSDSDKAPQECYSLQYDSPPKLSCDQDQKDAQSLATGAVDGKDSVSVTKVGEPFDLPTEIESQGSDVIDLASLATPVKRAILENAEAHYVTLDVSSVESGRELTFCVDNVESGNSYSLEIETTRDQHSARTFGGTREDLNDSKRQGYNDYDDEVEEVTSTESSESAAESDSLSDDEEPTDGESSQDTLSPVQIIAEVTLSSDEDNPTSEMKVQDPSDSGDDNKQPDNQSSAGNDQSTPTETVNNNYPSEGTPKDTSSSCSGHVGGKRGRREDDEDDGDKKNNRRNPPDYLGKSNPDTAEPDETEEDETESKELSSAQLKKSKSKCQKKRKDKKRKNSPSKEKSKRSPSSSNAANSGSGKKRPMKSSKCTPVEKMLEEDSALDEEVSDAFLESFMHRLQAATEKKHPGLNNEFVKLLCEAEQSTGNADKELLAKIKILLKDYPDLLTEFTTYIESDENYVPVKEDEHFQEKQQNDAYVQFLRHLEKFTERNPQLKAKILHKLKVFSEVSDPSQREIAVSLEPFFQGNEVMMRAFKAILPSVYRPDSINHELDFEVVDMESEEFSTQEDHNVESVTLPEEKAVPATNTCPCVCHDASTATHVYSTRAKHCQKCCLKFQDGKVFVHNGRVTKQVNVEMTSVSDAKKKSSGNTCKSCVQDSNSAALKFKESFVAPNVSKAKEEAEFKRPKAHASHQPQTQAPAIPSSTVTSCGSQEVLEDLKANSSSTKTENPDAEKKTLIADRKAWSLEEDQLILNAVKSAEADLDEVFEKLTSKLQNRDRTEVESRCVELISLLQSEFGSVADELGNEGENTI